MVNGKSNDCICWYEVTSRANFRTQGYFDLGLQDRMIINKNK